MKGIESAPCFQVWDRELMLPAVPVATSHPQARGRQAHLHPSAKLLQSLFWVVGSLIVLKHASSRASVEEKLVLAPEGDSDTEKSS